MRITTKRHAVPNNITGVLVGGVCCDLSFFFVILFNIDNYYLALYIHMYISN